MKKKIIALTMIFMISLNFLSLAHAIDEKELEAANRLVTLGIISGYGNGDLGLENQMTRAEFATVIVRLIGKEAEAGRGPTVFTDVKSTHWASGYINVAHKHGLMAGYGNNRFGPSDPITNAQVLAVMVRILGYQNTVDFSKPWPVNYITKATDLGIADDSIIPANSIAIRAKVFHYIDRSLLVKINR